MGDPSQRGTVVVLLQDMLEVVTDMMVNEIRFNLKAVILEYINIYSLKNIKPDLVRLMFISELAELNQSSKDTGQQIFAGTEGKPAILFPPVVTAQWEEQVLSNITSILILYVFFSLYSYSMIQRLLKPMNHCGCFR